MMTALYIIFVICVLIAFFGMVGYPAVLLLLEKYMKPQKNLADREFLPTVTLMIVAHNEEDVMEQKMINALSLYYPHEKFDILVSLDNCTDNTEPIVRRFIDENPERNIKIYATKKRMGKTNAQNEAQKTVESEILVMTDANSQIEQNAIRELVSYFSSEDVAYVCGRLAYSNADGETSSTESAYWNIDLRMRDIESRIQTITAGNGALYACRNADYIDIPAVQCHDGAMPRIYAHQNKRALFNPDAVAYEKAGETHEDEFKRKVRMNRNILNVFPNTFSALNVRRLKWYSFFHFGHRTCRYLLWLVHILAFICSAVLAALGSVFGCVTLALQLIWILVTFAQYHKPVKNRLIRFAGYYGMTIAAQLAGVWKQATGKSRPFWEKAETTR